MEVVNVSFGGGLSMQLTPVVVGLASTTPSTILEGDTITLTFTTNTPSAYPYTISGVTSEDIGGASLTGTFTANGETRTYTVTNDFVTEGPETFLITLDNGQAGAAFTILDRYFTFTSNVATVSETGANSFTVTLVSSNSFPIPYTVSGNTVVGADFVTGNVSGNFMSNGETILFTLAADRLTEGDEPFKLSLNQYPNANISVTLNDTSNTGSQAEFTTPGTYTWFAPIGVTSISVVAVGGGGGAGSNKGGGGGALAYKTSATVIPGTAYSVVVGAGGPNAISSSGISGEYSSFGSNIVYASGGFGAYIGHASRGTGGNVIIGDGGGYGGTANGQGGGGAAGYSGNGGNSTVYTGLDGTGGGGGGSGSTRFAGGGGGGVGIYGEGSSGLGGFGQYQGGYNRGQGGSGGLPATNIAMAQAAMSIGGLYGAGGGGIRYDLFGLSAGAQGGAQGAVRIIWGAGRAYPSTNTANVL
jgi:hypothetical protein